MIEVKREPFLIPGYNGVSSVKSTRLGDNFRRNLRKAGNRFEREPGAGVRLLSGRDADPARLDEFLASLA